MRGPCARTSSLKARSTRTDHPIGSSIVTSPPISASSPRRAGIAPTLVVREIAFGVRPVRLRLPFRFGAATLEACPQLFVRASVDIAGHSHATGFAAEMMVPKWFDKREGFTPRDNIGHLAASCERAARVYVGDAPAGAFGLFTRHYAALMDEGERGGATALSSAYGQALLDRAVLDALCRALDLSFFDVVGGNLIGIDHATLAGVAALDDLRGNDWNGWLAALRPLRAVDARHTIGMLDALDDASVGADGLPVGLRAVISRYGVRAFKIKLGGDPPGDAARLADVLKVLDAASPGHRYTLDGNEQYRSVAALAEFLSRLRALPAYRQRPDALLYLEQPLARDASLTPELHSLDSPVPLLLDEADGRLDSFPQAAALGWHGVSSKSCKGLYKALLNRARCDRWNVLAQAEGRAERFFMSAEDLTCQAGLAVQQDLALLALLGLDHTERNGHHYGDGFGTAPPEEADAFAAAHPDLYTRTPSDGTHPGRPRLHITGGRIAFDSLFAPGFAHRAQPMWSSLHPLATAASMV